MNDKEQLTADLRVLFAELQRLGYLEGVGLTPPPEIGDGLLQQFDGIIGVAEQDVAAQAD